MWTNLIVHIILVQLWVDGEKAQPSSGHMREKRPMMSFRGHEDPCYCTKVVACLAYWCRGKTFPSPSKCCLTTLMTFKIPNITWDVGHSFNLYVGLQRPGGLYVLGIPPGAPLIPQSTSTDLGQGPNLRAGSGRALCVPWTREHEERPAVRREKNAEGPKYVRNMYIYI